MVLTGREKATIFLSILGAETSSRILRYLPDELADLIASGINHLPSPSPEALSEVMNEFKSFLALPESRKVPPPPPPPIREEKPQPLASKKTYATLIYERPQMIAFLLSLLPEEQRDDVLHGLPREKGVVQELLSEIKKNPLTAKLESQLKEQFRDKLFL
jgi:flagellar motor switch protein FliG